MRKIGAFLIIAIVLTGCTGKRGEMDEMMQLRAKLLGCLECSFDASVTADYGDSFETFGMSCQADSQGNLLFSVTAPETIKDISGTIRDGDGFLTFDDTALSFPLLADGQVTPVSAPWIFLKTLRSGYLTSCCREDDKLHLTINDSYEENALRMEIWLDQDHVPVVGEIYYEGRRIVTLNVDNFNVR